MTTDVLNLDRVNHFAAPRAPEGRRAPLSSPTVLRLGAAAFFIRYHLAWLS